VPEPGATLLGVKRLLLGGCLLALGAAGFLGASGLAGARPSGSVNDPTTTWTTEPGTTTQSTATTETTIPTAPSSKPKPKPEPKPVPTAPARLPRGVTVGGVHVGGLTRAAALAAIRVAFRSPLVVSVGDERVAVSPRRLGAKAYVEGAVARAARARRGASVPLVVTVRGADVRAWVVKLARSRNRAVRDARVVLQGLRPRIVPEREGYEVKKDATTAVVVDALHRNLRGPVKAVAITTKPKVRVGFFSSAIVIRRDSKRLFYYKGPNLVLARTFVVATGQPSFPTPTGSFHIIQMWRDPWWYPPPSPWAQGEQPIPPGPGNPLGTRWMGISAPAVGIHGTPDAASLGYSASHGCIRMAIPSAEWLFNHVKVGTPVIIVPV
jgi:lipoprotein-anchoring transpeptidase ErfK/SrfK